jgi:hypothetical protein
VGSIPTQGTTNRKTVNRERAPKRKLAFFLEQSDSIVFSIFKRSLTGTLALANESLLVKTALSASIKEARFLFEAKRLVHFFGFHSLPAVGGFTRRRRVYLPKVSAA